MSDSADCSYGSREKKVSRTNIQNNNAGKKFKMLMSGTHF